MARAGPPFRVSHVVLDVDGTLVDFMGGMRAGLAAAAARLSELVGQPVERATLRAERGRLTADPGWRSRSLEEIRDESFHRILVSAGVTAGDAVADVVATYDRECDAAVRVYPDAQQALDALRALDLTLVAASNGNIDLEAVGLAHYFALTQFAPQAGVAKPDPRFFSQAVERAGASPGRPLAVGDRLDNDYAPAQAAGLHAVLIDRDGAVTDPGVLRVGALTELTALIEAP